MFIDYVITEDAVGDIGVERQRLMGIVQGKRRWIVYSDTEHPDVLMLRNGLTRHKSLTNFKEGDSVAVDRGLSVSKCSIKSVDGKTRVFFHRLTRIVDPESGYFEDW